MVDDRDRNIVLECFSVLDQFFEEALDVWPTIAFASLLFLVVVVVVVFVTVVSNVSPLLLLPRLLILFLLLLLFLSREVNFLHKISSINPFSTWS